MKISPWPYTTDFKVLFRKKSNIISVVDLNFSFLHIISREFWWSELENNRVGVICGNIDGYKIQYNKE